MAASHDIKNCISQIKLMAFMALNMAFPMDVPEKPIGTFTWRYAETGEHLAAAVR